MTAKPAVASLLIVGSEITQGKIADVHGKYLASLLTSCDINLAAIRIVPDGPSIRNEVDQLIVSSDLLIITGGLGPTSDDITRDAVAEAAGVELRFDEQQWGEICSQFKGAPPDSNKRQAVFPEGFAPIPNENGTAPGLLGRIRSCHVVALPGPPRELAPMSESFLKPFLAETYGRTKAEGMTCSAFLVSESALEDSFRRAAGPEGRWRTQASAHRIEFELYCGARNEAVFEALETEFGLLCIRRGAGTIQQRLVETLKNTGKTITCAESCTGGMIGTLITEVAGSSDVFWGGFITYADEAKAKVLGVTSLQAHGAVSSQTVEEMTAGALRVSRADIAVSVSGIAGPGGGTPEKPVGTVWIGVRTADEISRSWKFLFRGDRDRIRRRTAVAAMILADAIACGASIDNDPFWSYI